MASRAAILYDPKDEYRLGDSVSLELVPALRARGVVSIPYSLAGLARSPQAGHVARYFGREGLVPPPAMYGRIVPFLLFVTPHGGPHVHLALRLRKTGGRPTGKLRLIADTAQHGAAAMGVSGDACVDLDALDPEKADERGGWFAAAQARIGSNAEGFVGLALYGAGSGVAIEWAAVSQSDV